MTSPTALRAPTTMTAPLLLTADELLAGDVSRLAAAAGVSLDVCTAGSGWTRWTTAACVLVGADVADEVAVLDPPRRDGVHLVSPGPRSDALYRPAVAIGAASVLELPGSDDRLVQMLTDTADERAGTGLTVAVVGGSGGVGATVLAAALALTAGRSGPVMLVDLDPLGPGLRRVVGLEDDRGVTWRDLARTPGRLGSRALRESLPVQEGVGVLGWPDDLLGTPPAELVREVVSAGQRGHSWVVLDVPRVAGPVTADLLSRCDQVLLVVRPALGPVASAVRLADRLATSARTVGVVVRARRSSPLAEDVARVLGLPLYGELPDQRRLDEHLDLGLGPVHDRRGALATTAKRLVQRMERR